MKCVSASWNLVLPEGKGTLKIAIASGKGGTGKTLVSTNLAKIAANLDSDVVYVDCDVEEPNGHLFLRGVVEQTRPVLKPIPVIDPHFCDKCGICSDFCQFNALATLPNQTIVFPELCHSCGGCRLVCPMRAIQEIDHTIGVVRERRVGTLSTIDGLVNIGVSSVTTVIRAVKDSIPSDAFALLDAPPGTACPVVETLEGCSFALLVAEPTPFGLHDFTLAVELLRELQLPFAAVVNRVGLGDRRMHDFCRNEGIEILLELPDDRRIAEMYSRGKLLVDEEPEYRQLFEVLYRRLQERVARAESFTEHVRGGMEGMA